MKAMILEKISPVETEPLRLVDIPVPEPKEGEILVKITACGVCHTELDEIEGRIKPKLPVILGHEVVGKVEITSSSSKFRKGERVGIAWINSACGRCNFCREERENLCPDFKGTGCDVDGGYAQYTVVKEEFAYPIPDVFSDTEAAPLLCAGAIGYRALKLTGIENGQILGLFGFGASAHIVIQIVKYRFPDTKVFVFTRPHQKHHRLLAQKFGADWVGATGENPPQKLQAAIDFTPAWKPVVEALRVMEKGGRVVINAIRKEEKDKDSLLQLDYATCLWQEKEIKSVANITRRDAQEFLPLAARIPIRPQIEEFKLEEANKALILLKEGKIRGAAVLKVN